jgi:1-acyl-sn-glycerol-3-phosphate acyltransferase
MKGKSRQGFIYRVFRAYLRFVHDTFFYRKSYRVNMENIPPDGTPMLIASNHQNCLCDPVGVVVAFKDRKPGALARADVFATHPLVNKILRKMGLLPAYRLTFDGEESLGKNKEVFNVSGKELVNGRSILIYPEGAHQDKHWLGDFSFGYTKMAFEAAELDDFQTEIFILPCCNHYSDYFDIQKDILLKFGTPVSLKPFYELYKTKPRTAQRQVNALVREQMEGMMLNITDLDNYEAIDFLRNTYGRKYALKHGFRADHLPDKLMSDKAFFKSLEEVKTENEDVVQQVYNDTLRYKNELKKLNVVDRNFDHAPGWGAIIASVVVMIALLPVWLFSLWPNIIIYKVPDLVLRRVKDKMFYNSFLYGISVLITMPLLYTLSFVLAWVYVNFCVAIVYALALPYLGLFAWYYKQYAVRIMQNMRFRRLKGTEKFRNLKELREVINERLNNILK